MRTIILGASRKPARYSNMAFHMLRKNGYEAVPVHPTLKELDGVPVRNSLDEIDGEVHTLTLYIGPRHIGREIPKILRLRPGRVILNPGTESAELMRALDGAKIPYLRACTLVLLSTGQYGKAA